MVRDPLYRARLIIGAVLILSGFAVIAMAAWGLWLAYSRWAALSATAIITDGATVGAAMFWIPVGSMFALMGGVVLITVGLHALRG